MIPLILAALAMPPHITPRVDSAAAALLRAKDQALLDAFAPGDRATWAKTLTDDAVYVDENGAIMHRAEFLQGLTPLPAGSSGHIDIVSYEVRILGDVALVIHRDDEHETYHGHALRAGYLTTETWVRQSGEWKLALVHAYVVAHDPPAIALPTTTLDEYVGQYRAGPDLEYVVSRSGATLVAGAPGKSAHPLLPEAPDVFFVPGQPRTRRLFQRDTAGHITGFVDRREGEDIVWTRVPH
jgi:ketosteroid isomerase-like protein